MDLQVRNFEVWTLRLKWYLTIRYVNKIFVLEQSAYASAP